MSHKFTVEKGYEREEGIKQDEFETIGNKFKPGEGDNAEYII